MVRESVDLLELLRKQAAGGDLDFLREAVAVLAEAVMEAEVAAQIGAGHGERSPDRTTWRNGYRPRRWDTRAGSIELQIPKLRQGSYFPALLEPRRRAERALLAVVQQAYVEGVSTRRVDDLVRSLGCEGISKSQVSRICAELDGVVASFLERPLDGGPYRYLWLDALTQRVREEGRIAQVSVVVATAVNADGKREVLGIDVGTSEDGAVWLSFLRGLVARGLSGVDTRDLRRPSRPQGGDRDRLRRRLGGSAAGRTSCGISLTRGTEERRGAGGDDGAHHLPAALGGGGARPARPRGGATGRALPRGRGDARRGGAGGPGVHGLPGRALEAGLVEQPAGTPQSRDPPAHRRGRHLPQPRRGRAARRRGARRAARRVGRREGYDDGDPAASAGARGHFNRGGTCCTCWTASK